MAERAERALSNIITDIGPQHPDYEVLRGHRDALMAYVTATQKGIIFPAEPTAPALTPPSDETAQVEPERPVESLFIGHDFGEVTVHPPHQDLTALIAQLHTEKQSEKSSFFPWDTRRKVTLPFLDQQDKRYHAEAYFHLGNEDSKDAVVVDNVMLYLNEGRPVSDETNRLIFDYNDAGQIKSVLFAYKDGQKVEVSALPEQNLLSSLVTATENDMDKERSLTRYMKYRGIRFDFGNVAENQVPSITFYASKKPMSIFDKYWGEGAHTDYYYWVKYDYLPNKNGFEPMILEKKSSKSSLKAKVFTQNVQMLLDRLPPLALLSSQEFIL